MRISEQRHREKNIEFTAELIMKYYSLPNNVARAWADKALVALDAHGGSASDPVAIDKVDRVVVSSWLAKKPNLQ